MALPSSLVSQFVKITKDETPTKSESTVYGTAVKSDGATYVKFDGSELLTPATFATNIEDGERVTVMIKNHAAIVTGNITSPAARTAEVESVSSDLTKFKDDVANVKILIADKVSTDELEAVNAEIDDLKAKTAEIDELRANDVEINRKLTATEADISYLRSDEIIADHISALTAKFNEIYSEKLTADELYAAFADLTVLSAGTADFESATVEHLVSNLFNLTGQGVMEDVFIHNLKIAYAQMVGATIGNLVLKSKDGNYYEIDVNPEGKVTASLVTVTEGEISAGQTDGGKVIVATSMTVDDMNATTIKATHALINKITAASIDTEELFANNAFINQLTTSRIYNDTSLRMVIGEYDNIAKWFTFDENGLTIRKPAYLDDFGNLKTPIWSSVTDEKGYHVRSDEMVEPAGSFEGEGLTTPSVKIGEIRSKRTSTGGWVWTDA